MFSFPSSPDRPNFLREIISRNTARGNEAATAAINYESLGRKHASEDQGAIKKRGEENWVS